MKYLNYKTTFFYLLIGFQVMVFSGCKNDLEVVVEELDFDRILGPYDMTAFIRNQTTIELDWKLREEAESYVVEFSEDSLEFSTIIRTITVFPEDLPIQETFFGETRYSARVKAVGGDDTSLGESSWTAITIKTEAENIYQKIQDGDIALDGEVTLRWPAASGATRFVISPGNVVRDITGVEDAAGMATITGLDPLTTYSVEIYSGNSRRGTTSFLTLVDPNCATCVPIQSSDDLDAIIAGATAGHTLVLYPGDYTVNSGETLIIDRSLNIRGLYPYDKPNLRVQFDVTTGADIVGLYDLEMTGDDGVSLTTVLDLANAGETMTSITISGCYVHNYGRQLIYGNVASILGSFEVVNSVFEDFIAGGGDFIDFRTAHVGSVSVTKSTFANAPSARDFIRIDAAATYTATGLATNVTVDKCTFYATSNSADRIMYVRFNGNSSSVTNCIFAATDAYYSNQSSTTQTSCSKNNYFNATGFYSTGTVQDISGNYTTLDPGFADAASYDFTVSTQSLIDNEIGDPRWFE